LGRIHITLCIAARGLSDALSQWIIGIASIDAILGEFIHLPKCVSSDITVACLL
jgi:hypothetical protein